MNFFSKIGSSLKNRFSRAKAQQTGEGESPKTNIVKSAVKKKIALSIAGAATPIIIWVLVGILMIIILLFPILSVYERLDGVGTVFEKVMNFLSFRGFNTNQDAFFDKLRDEYEDYQSYTYREDELDVALISATIHFSRMMDSSYYQDTSDFKDPNGTFGDDYFNDKVIVGKDDTKQFYQWANEKIGSSYTLYLDKRGLMGALVSGRITSKCVDEENAPSVFDAIADIVHQLFRNMKDTTEDAWRILISAITEGFLNKSAVSLEKLQNTYQGAVGIGYDVKNIFDFSHINTDCGEGEVAVPGFYKFNDYDKYDNYLKTFFIPKYLLPKDTPDNQRDAKIEQILEEIYSARDGFLYLMGQDKNNPEIIYSTCQSITVEGEYGGTYTLEEYVAGVVQNELGGGGPEALKAQAVAARTYALVNTSNCTKPITNSTRSQTFSWPLRDNKYLQAAYDTSGQVLTFGGKTFAAFYASYPKIGYSWNGIPDCDVTCTGGECTTTLYRAPNMEPNEFTMPNTRPNGSYWNGSDLLNQGGHCVGMSQVGALYLEEGKGYDYRKILEQFYSPGFMISSLSSRYTHSGLIAGNYAGFYQRIAGPISSDQYFNSPYVNSSNLGQCVWYVKGRAQEILSTIELDEATRSTAMMAVRNTHGNGRDWFQNPSLQIFGSSNDYTKPKIGSIIVWEYSASYMKRNGGTNYGHVAIIEDIDEKNGTITISEGWRQRYNGSWNYSNGWADVRFSTATHPISWVIDRGSGDYRFLGYVYLLD